MRGSEGEKEITAAEREWCRMVRARKEHHRHRRRGVKQRGTKKAAGRFARVAALSCERREETKWMTAKEKTKERDGEAVGRLVGQEDEREANARRRTPGRIVKREESWQTEEKEKERKREGAGERERERRKEGKKKEKMRDGGKREDDEAR